jgi:hypothetical protein
LGQGDGLNLCHRGAELGFLMREFGGR